MFAPSRQFEKRTYAAVTLSVIAALCWCRSASAHEGPPFPILMDKPLAGHVVSVWADPDIGDATFFVVVETPDGGTPEVAPSVSMWFEPVNGRLARATCEAKPQRLRNQLQFVAEPFFDQRDVWAIGFRVSTVGGHTEQLTTQIESTPPGFGAWDLAIYLFPFVWLGGMWIWAMMRRRRPAVADREHASGAALAMCDFERSNDTTVDRNP